MDSLTQAILGAAVGEAAGGKKLGKAAPIAGALIATIPDLDIILTPFLDQYQRIAIHRGYSHSILFCVALSFLLAYLLSKMKMYRITSFARLYLISFLSLSTHVLLDSFTTYGTQLFLPLTDWRVSFDSIAIIDPVYTIPLAIGMLMSVIFYNKEHPFRIYPNIMGLTVSSLYLLFTLANKQHIEKVFYEQLEDQEIQYKRLLTVPVKIANVIWYGVAKNDSNIYIGKYSMLQNNKIIFDVFPINDQILDTLNKELADRMRWFSKGYYTVAEKDGKIRVYNMQCDMQGVRKFGDYKAPTAFYYEITPGEKGSYILDSGMHMETTK